MQDTRVVKPFGNRLIGDIPTSTLRNDPLADKNLFHFPSYLSRFFSFRSSIALIIQRNSRTVERREKVCVNNRNK